MADFSTDTLITSIIKAVLIVVFLLLSVLIAIWFERKVIGRMQERPGPNVHGPFGLLQSLFDAMKLLIKEDITVKAADKVVYILAPMISVFCALLVFAVIPLGPEVRIPFTDIITPLQLTDFPVATLYILACASVGVYGIVLGGWSSGSTYPLLGSVRSTAQVISYELAMGLSLVSVFIMAGSMSTSQIVDSQDTMWWLFPLFPAFIIYVISMMGEVNRLPFDLPEAGGELVSGYMTEYSSMKFAWFFLAEYINMLNVSAVATTLFLGGYHAPWPISQINDGMFDQGWWGLLWFLIKLWGFMFFFVWVRGTVVRFRYDQFMIFGWKVLIPFALGWIFILAAFRGVQEFGNIDARPILFAIAAIAAVLLVVTLIIDQRTSARSQPERASANTNENEPPFDAFANGYPVPPLPGQTLPPSPRAARRAAQPATRTAQVESTGQEDNDDN
ncbi:NADH-quinone oxidoreductase subunit NuoH [Jonesia denitrificans]|uniref:NADH-quinone oxidoreductase subunit H n=1 Tax=Jonesia denitrificans (strain ATCC 14870 / DSM 20603 / BCRC 15368 / CIP 55.134 / JCM 11481 / NBRC 15587 / NCTC 10816 / Prevot 55134) TaxID=471856 RepID=C7R0Q3_JONDD|nr:NADH-quinone oxidoreductase subunit NuoH [Jonesia denitrificans]ACV08210.1 NADH dehydrogenase (quinone) [Jonesia denitrificans DSM 20603]ASE08118.1 NADH-quinone oxidoreductase subunit NuoH [Jonesia denitrificans]QXB42722.1 NADH-quinone oxidoreductase subunit NuoH [Jonesia denitrificans]SQH20191.1 NADH-quinone oxidoreductase subunit H [Jonesia denitrificans]